MVKPDGIRVIQVIAGLYPGMEGRPIRYRGLCAALAEAGGDVTLFSVAQEGEVGTDVSNNGYHDRRFFPWDYARVPVVHQLRYSSALTRAIRQAAAGTQPIHNHGLWLLPNVQTGWIAAKFKKPPAWDVGAGSAYVFTRQKAFILACPPGPVVRHAASLHATSERNTKRSALSA